MTYVEATPIHKLLAGKMRWTDSLWQQAEALLNDCLSDDGKVRMEEVFFGPRPKYLPDRSRLDDYLQYPPTIFVGALDLVGWEAAVQLRLEQMFDKSEAEAMQRVWVSRPGESGDSIS
jgi:hypothetical protein